MRIESWRRLRITDLSPRSFEEQPALLGGDRQLGGQALGQLLARPELACLDLLDRLSCTVSLCGQLLKGERARPTVGGEHISK